ncbi:uridine phosphorylase 1-like [Amphibalanus amphitrite]|uniref:uridine phosphorylase 1-like n=1 Tax=Amphibalanus amphitrite TaxID=1232801 RepID=UPI001C91091B|nr:uridine phosphorylase 1-like isoform X3 [Amphibalanus amphitrite]XP_043226691.1 uridine phosphorylase 1-like [Amphibalanus amphitrite]
MGDGNEQQNAGDEETTIARLNPHVREMTSDILYHLALGSGSHDLHAMFGDVKFVCMGGTPRRMEQFAHFIMKEIGYQLPTGAQLLDISLHSYRYSMFKVGPVLSVSHGMGMPSVGILLHEMIKLMYHARVKNPTFFRLGTCGGIGIDGGNLVITESAVDGLMNPYLEQAILGEIQKRPGLLDPELAAELKALSTPEDPWQIYSGKTMCTTDFYEGQGRLDGAFCDYTEEDKFDFLRKIHAEGIINMEMESLMFAALCHHAGIRGAVICVTLLNRMKGDQVTAEKSQQMEWQEYPQRLVARYIRQQLEAADGVGSGAGGLIRSLSQLHLTRQTSEQFASSE